MGTEKTKYINNKKINLNNTVYDLVSKYPEISNIMKKAGFESISNPGMINTAGRFMTIPKGAKMKNIPLVKVIELLKENGFEIVEK